VYSNMQEWERNIDGEGQKGIRGARELLSIPFHRTIKDDLINPPPVTQSPSSKRSKRNSWKKDHHKNAQRDSGGSKKKTEKWQPLRKRRGEGRKPRAPKSRKPQSPGMPKNIVRREKTTPKLRITFKVRRWSMHMAPTLHQRRLAQNDRVS